MKKYCSVYTPDNLTRIANSITSAEVKETRTRKRQTK